MDLSGTMQGAGGVGGLLALSIHGGDHEGDYYPTYNGNGNIVEYLDDEGETVAHYEYDPFGNDITPVADKGTLHDLFPYRFSTKPMDQVTGWYYYGYRYYDPVTGRWPSRDSIEEEGGINLYGFVGNVSIKYYDYLGLVQVPDGFVGTPFNELDNAGYYGSRASSMNTAADPNEREYCGIICCRNGIFIISRPHAGNTRPRAIINGIKTYFGRATCHPRLTQAGRRVECPDTWTYAAAYHSHPRTSHPAEAEYFSDFDYNFVNDNSGVPLYLGYALRKSKVIKQIKREKIKKKFFTRVLTFQMFGGYEEK